MKKLLSLMLLSGLSLGLFAQVKTGTDVDHNKTKKHIRAYRGTSDKTPEQIAELKTERLDKKLNFTEEQRNAMYSLQMDRVKQQRDRRVEMRQLNEKRRSEMKETQGRMAEILSDEQKELMKNSLAQDRKGKMRRGGKFHQRGKYRMQQREALENKSES